MAEAKKASNVKPKAKSNAAKPKVKSTATKKAGTQEVVSNQVIESNVHTADPSDIEQNKAFGVLAYLGILVLVPLLAAPQSPFAQFHAKQGLNLVVLYLIAAAPLFVLSWIPIINILAFLGFFALGCAGFVFMVLGIINAASGKMEKLPIISDIALIK